MKRHASARREFDHGERRHTVRFVCHNPSQRAASTDIFPSGKLSQSLAPCGYVYFKRTYDNVSGIAPNSEGLSIVPTWGSAMPALITDPYNMGPTSTATDGLFAAWELQQGMQVGMPASATGYTGVNVYHDGIGVGSGGSHFFSFQFTPCMLPDGFYTTTREFSKCKFKEITLQVRPRHAKPWAAGPSGSTPVDGMALATGVFSHSFPVMTGQGPNTWGQPAAGADGTIALPALTQFGVDMYKWNPPLSFTASVHNHAIAWNSLSTTDFARIMPIREMAERGGFVRVNPNETISCTRAPHEWNSFQVMDFETQPATQPYYATIPVIGGASARPMKALDLPQYGFFNPAYPPTSTSSLPMPMFNVNMCTLLVDTNSWMANSFTSSVGTPAQLGYQDFTCNQDAGAQGGHDKGPTLMNPPLEWDVTYIVDVEFWGSPTAGKYPFQGVPNVLLQQRLLALSQKKKPAAAAAADEDSDEIQVIDE